METKILYIEDDHASRLLVRKLFSRSRFAFYEAASGIEGLRIAQEIVPQLILIDIRLPDIHGTELATKIRSIAALQSCVLVALTGIDDDNARDVSLIAGCDGYIRKPIDADRFIGQLEEFIAGKREQVPAALREAAGQFYQQSIVNRLTEKVQELQSTNQLLADQTLKLSTYSGYLERLLDIITHLQRSYTKEQLSSRLVKAIATEFRFPRCIFLEADESYKFLRIGQSFGLEPGTVEDVEIPVAPRLFQQLFRESQLRVFHGVEEIPNQHIQKLFNELGGQEFILGFMGTSMRQIADLDDNEQMFALFEQLAINEAHSEERKRQDFQEHFQQYLASEIFYFGGYLYVDCSKRAEPLSNDEAKMLEMLMHSASFIYQNLRLRDQLKSMFFKAEKDAITDHLTGLFNFRHFSQQLDREIFRARRHELNFALLILDIDYFKIYNDTFGHPAGDEVLRRLGRLLKDNTRSSDLVARYGGEEFAIVCPELDREEGEMIAKKLCHIISDTPFPRERELPHKNVTISIGVASFPEDGDAAAPLIRAADSALYYAKERGRNQVQSYEQVPGE